MNSRTRLGRWGEDKVTSSLSRTFEIVARNVAHNGDVTIRSQAGNTAKIEVKTGKRSLLDKSTQFCLKRENKTDVNDSDYVVFLNVLCEDCIEFYVVPVSVIRTWTNKQGKPIKTLKIRGNNHKISQYRTATINFGVAQYVN